MVFEIRRGQRDELLEAVDEEGTTTHEVSVGGLRLGSGWSLRDGQKRSLSRSELATLPLPATLEAGRPREVQRLSSKGLLKALRRTGIHWLGEDEQLLLLSALKEQGEDSTWMERLAETFVMDARGAFKRLNGYCLHLQHVFQVTRKIEEKLAAKRSAKAGLVDVALERSEFGHCLVAGGVHWLSASEMDVIFETIGGTEVTLNDWMSRFLWDPMQAATELEGVLKVWERRLARRAADIFRRHKKSKALVPPSLNFWEFHGVLMEMSVDWLTMRQQRLLFKSLDTDRNGRVDTAELQALSQKRAQIELWREEREELRQVESDAEGVVEEEGKGEEHGHSKEEEEAQEEEGEEDEEEKDEEKDQADGVKEEELEEKKLEHGEDEQEGEEMEGHFIAPGVKGNDPEESDFEHAHEDFYDSDASSPGPSLGPRTGPSPKPSPKASPKASPRLSDASDPKGYELFSPSQASRSSEAEASEIPEVEVNEPDETESFQDIHT